MVINPWIKSFNYSRVVSNYQYSSNSLVIKYKIHDLSMEKNSLDLSILLSEGNKEKTSTLSSSERTMVRSASNPAIITG